jgi:hypothetical protein
LVATWKILLAKEESASRLSGPAQVYTASSSRNSVKDFAAFPTEKIILRGVEYRGTD